MNIAKDYDDEDAAYTPAWQEKFTGIDRKTVIKFAREWSVTAEKTEGKCMVIIGAGINHWYHNNLMYRSAITALMLTRLRREKRRRFKSLCRTGKTRTGRALVKYGFCKRLDSGIASAKCAVVALHKQRAMAL